MTSELNVLSIKLSSDYLSYLVSHHLECFTTWRLKPQVPTTRFSYIWGVMRLASWRAEQCNRCSTFCLTVISSIIPDLSMVTIFSRYCSTYAKKFRIYRYMNYISLGWSDSCFYSRYLANCWTLHLLILQLYF